MTTAIALTVTLFVGVPPVESTPYDVNYVTDGTLVGASFGLLAIWTLGVQGSLAADRGCKKTPEGRCDPARLSGLDRRVVGNESEFWATAGDVGQAAAIGIAAVAAALDPWISDVPNPGTGMVADVMVIAESLALATVFNEALRYVVARPRPTMYGSDASTGAALPRGSFPSGHTMAATTAATAYATTFWLRHPESPWRWPVIVASATVSLLTGYARVADGQHFYTDSLAAVIVGSAFGVAVPLFHEREVTVTVTAGQAGGPGLGLVLEQAW